MSLVALVATAACSGSDATAQPDSTNVFNTVLDTLPAAEVPESGDPADQAPATTRSPATTSTTTAEPTAATVPPRSGPATVLGPPAAGLPANGVIATNVGTAGWQQVDPTGSGQTMKLPPSAVPNQWPVPVFSADGTRAAYALNGLVKVRELATGDERDVARCSETWPCTIAWSPDGATLALNRDPWSIALFRSDGRIDQVGTIVVEDLDFFPHIVDWTHDGERIVYVPQAPDPNGPRPDVALESVRIDGTDRSPILFVVDLPSLMAPTWVDVSPLDSTIGWIQTLPPVELPEGEEPDPSSMPFSLQLRMVNVDGSGQRTLADLGECWCQGFSPDFTWSPDGEQYAYFASNAPSMGDMLVASAFGDPDPEPMAIGGGELVWFPAVV